MAINVTTVRMRTWFIHATQDLARSVDYVTTRPDVDSKRLVFAGVSFGSSSAPVFLVAEPRFRAAMLLAGGYQPEAWLPEIDSRRYTPYVKLPILMINGASDSVFPATPCNAGQWSLP
jgi:dienelactone hydrolase